MSKLFFILPILFLFIACEKVVNSGNFPIYSKYPTQLNTEWEYNTIMLFEYYDSTGNIDSSSVMDLGHTICKITNINDSIGNFSKLILFEEYDVATPTNIHKTWYVNADSGLYSIAYSNPGSSQIVIPKQHLKSFEYFIQTVKSIGVAPAFYFGLSNSNQVSDSIQFYTYPRKVLVYPLKIGSRWIELIEPFYRERIVRTTEIINCNGKDYNTYKIESEGDFKVIFNDYINLTDGLIKREILIDSVAIISPISPDPQGYYKFGSISNLVRVLKPER
uniref:Lipoprotein n=1 Tax=Ignavibacterium album TaxID=591197 RepID=A0A832G7R3_9BACT